MDLDVKTAMRDRLMRIVAKHVKAEDSALTDRQLVEAVLERFRAYNDHYLVDVSE